MSVHSEEEPGPGANADSRLVGIFFSSNYKFANKPSSTDHTPESPDSGVVQWMLGAICGSAISMDLPAQSVDP